MNAPRVTLRYDGKYDFMAPPFDRQWTILSHFIDADGQDRFKGSFSLEGLKQIGAVPAGHLNGCISNGGNYK